MIAVGAIMLLEISVYTSYKAKAELFTRIKKGEQHQS